MLASLELFKVPVPLPHVFVSGDGDEDPLNRAHGAGRVPARAEDLAYRVELWAQDGKTVEQTLAMTANSSIGYAAYYEAAREYPDRKVILLHRNRTLARSNPSET